MAVWKSDDAADSLTLTTTSSAYATPVTVDPATGAEQPTPNASRAADGKVTVSGLAVGKQPVILKFPESLPPKVDAIDPMIGANTTTCAVKVLGTNFQAASKVRLQQGTTVINGTKVILAKPGRITCYLNLRSKPLGKYAVFVKNPDGKERKLAGSFIVGRACGHGAGASISVFAGLLGLLSVAGLGWRRKRR